MDSSDYITRERAQDLMVKGILKAHEEKKVLRHDITVLEAEIEAYKSALCYYIEEFGACCSRCEHSAEDECQKNCIQAIKNYFKGKG